LAGPWDLIVPYIKYGIDHHPKNSFYIKYTLHKVIFPEIENTELVNGNIIVIGAISGGC
jgi:hypothetical protein